MNEKITQRTKIRKKKKKQIEEMGSNIIGSPGAIYFIIHFLHKIPYGFRKYSANSFIYEREREKKNNKITPDLHCLLHFSAFS